MREETAEKALLARVADSEVRLRRTIDRMAVFAGVFDPDGTVKEPNQTALAAADLRFEDVVGRPF